MDLRDEVIIKEKVINMLRGKLGKAEAKLFSAQCEVKVYSDEIQKQEKRLEKIFEGEIRV